MVYREFADGYQWTPDMVNQLTLYQLKILMSTKEVLKGKRTVKVGYEQFMLLQNAKQSST